MINNLNSLLQNILPDTIAIRRAIHANPELSFEEFETSSYIASELDKLQIPYTKGIAGTGIVGIIEGANASSKCIAFRADFDALPITEQNNCAYKSKNEGVMHACGHDVHTACLLGAARILHQTKSEWSGTVKLIFQPGEEKDPGGASIMIAQGVLENPKPNKIFALHVYPHLPAGTIGTKAGTYMASADEVYITVKGKGGHAAMPHLCIDPIVIASQIILQMQTIISRSANPIDNTVFTIGKIVGGTKGNIIPDSVSLEGTLRCMNEAWREKCFTLITNYAQQIAQSMGGSAEVNIKKGYPCVHNDVALTHEITGVLKGQLGTNQVVELPLRMTADDFAYYSHQIPGSYIRIGTTNADGTQFNSPVHTATFDIDESALLTGMHVICTLVAEG